MTIMTYANNSDILVEATQDDMDDLQIALNKFGMKNDIVRFVANLNPVKDQDLIKELDNLLTPYTVIDAGLLDIKNFTGIEGFSKTWIKSNPDKVSQILKKS